MAVVSRSSRPARECGKSRASSDSTRSVPKPEKLNCAPAAVAAEIGGAGGEATVVAADAAVLLIEGERDAAVGALDGLAAGRAEQDAGIAAAVEEEDNLLALGQPQGDALPQGTGEDGGLPSGAAEVYRHECSEAAWPRRARAGGAVGARRIPRRRRIPGRGLRWPARGGRRSTRRASARRCGHDSAALALACRRFRAPRQ